MLKKKIAIITGGGGFFAYQHALAMHKINAEIILIDINKKKTFRDQNKLKKNKYFGQYN